jgi:hypothetical protein
MIQNYWRNSFFWGGCFSFESDTPESATQIKNMTVKTAWVRFPVIITFRFFFIYSSRRKELQGTEYIPFHTVKTSSKDRQ